MRHARGFARCWLIRCGGDSNRLSPDPIGQPSGRIARRVFLAELSASGVPREIAEIVYEYYRSESIGKSFSVRPGDSLGQLFRREHDDVDHDALVLVRRVGLELPNEDKLKQWPGPINTVLDMALWLTWVRQLH